MALEGVPLFKSGAEQVVAAASTVRQLERMAALLRGEEAGRWPNGVVEPDGGGGAASNSFSELPLVGGWGRRPLELATLRLQNMVGVSLANWRELGAQDDRCITQLGGCALLSADGEVLYEWRDTGICNTAHFEDVLSAL